MSELTFKQNIVINEIEGKYKAIHSYDHIIWVIRSGYLTLIFGSWAFLLQGLIESGSFGFSIYILPMMVISMGLTIGGFIIDLNYVHRKFKVIQLLNQLMDLQFDVKNHLKAQDDPHELDLLRCLHVAGDERFSLSALIGAIIYLTPLICLIVCWFYLDYKFSTCFDLM